MTTPDMPPVSLESRVAALEMNAVISGALTSVLFRRLLDRADMSPADDTMLKLRGLLTRLEQNIGLIRAQIPGPGTVFDIDV